MSGLTLLGRLRKHRVGIWEGVCNGPRKIHTKAAWWLYLGAASFWTGNSRTDTQTMTWYLALMGSAEEMLKSLALFDFSERERCPAPSRICPPPQLLGLDSHMINWDISFSVCRPVLGGVGCIWLFLPQPALQPTGFLPFFVFLSFSSNSVLFVCDRTLAWTGANNLTLDSQSRI